MALAMDVKLEFQAMDFAMLLSALGAGEVDVAAIAIASPPLDLSPTPLGL